MEPMPEMMRVDEAAKVLRCSPGTIRECIKSGRLRAVKPLGRLLVYADQVREMVQGPQPKTRRGSRKRIDASLARLGLLKYVQKAEQNEANAITGRFLHHG